MKRRALSLKESGIYVQLPMECERTATEIKERRYSDSPGPWDADGSWLGSVQRLFIGCGDSEIAAP